MFGIIDFIKGEIDEFVDNPVKKIVKTVTQPVRDGLEIIDGLTEGELRTKAISRLGFDVASGMAISELIDWYKND